MMAFQVEMRDDNEVAQAQDKVALFPKKENGPTASVTIMVDLGDSSVFHKDPHDDVTVYTKLCIQFNYNAQSMENDEDFFLEYSSSNSDVGTWDLVKQYVAGTDFPCCIDDNPGNIAYNDTVKLDSADFLFTSGAKIGFTISVLLRAMVTTYILIK
jgi:hypothetical protein